MYQLSQDRTLRDMARELGLLAIQYVSERRQLGQLTGTSPRTVSYRLGLFVEFVGRDIDVKRISRRKIENWLLSMKVAPATLRVRLSSVRTFCGWLVDHRYLRSNPADGIAPARQPRSLPPRALSTDQLAAIYRACPNLRADLIVTLMVQEGLRCGGVAALQVGDIDLQGRTLTVVEKGDEERALPITDEAAGVLRRYLAENRLTAGPLIRSERDPQRGIAPGSVSRLVGQVMREAGVAESSHALRHTAASDMLERGVNVRTVQHILGHRSLQTTQRYLRRYVGDLSDAINGRTYRP